MSQGLALIGACGLLATAACRTDSAPGRVASVPKPPPAYQVTMPVPPPTAPHSDAPQALSAAIHALGAQFGGKVGIAVHSVGQGWTVESNGDIPMPQQSVSKLWVAITMLDLRDQGKLRLDSPIVVTKNDITLFHQPVAALIGETGYHTTVGDLDFRALTTSDNTANDRILTYVGGPQAVEAMLRRKSIEGIRFGLGERDKQSQTAGLTWRQDYAAPGAFQQARARLPMDVRARAFNAYVDDPMDGAEARAMAETLSRLVKGELLSASSTKWLLDTMGASRTGRARLRAVLPDGWDIMHKTGTGQDFGRRTAGFNDVGILTAPDGRQYTVAVLIGDTSRPVHERQRLIQSVASAVIADDADHRGMAVAQQGGGNQVGAAAN